MSLSIGELQTSWADSGLYSIDAYGDQRLWDEMTEEAESLAELARPVEFQKVATRRDGSFTTDQRFAIANSGPVINGLLRDRELLELTREITKLSRLVPARAGYNYYRRGDFLGIHRDIVKCTLTYTVALTPGVTPMRCRPDLRAVTNPELLEYVQRAGILPSDGVPVDPPYRGLLGFDGYNVPHWRMPFEADRAILGTFCYFDL